MVTIVKYHYCGGYDTVKATNGRESKALATTGAVAGEAPLQQTTGVSGVLGANLGYRCDIVRL